MTHGLFFWETDYHGYDEHDRSCLDFGGCGGVGRFHGFPPLVTTYRRYPIEPSAW